MIAENQSCTGTHGRTWGTARFAGKESCSILLPEIGNEIEVHAAPEAQFQREDWETDIPRKTYSRLWIATPWHFGIFQVVEFLLMKYHGLESWQAVSVNVKWRFGSGIHTKGE